MTKDEIINAYKDYVLQYGHDPKSIFQFCTHIKLEETEFYKSFGSFEGIKKAIWEQVIHKTLERLQVDETYKGYSAREKLLSFYFTFFEEMIPFRSYLLMKIGNKGWQLVGEWKEAKKVIKKYFDDLDIKESMFDKFTNKIGIDDIKYEGYWAQFLFLLRFWVKDESAGFEQTDVAIEKVVNTTFDIFDSNALTSLIDLGKFLFQSK